MSTEADGNFTKGSNIEKIMNTLAQYPGVWFSSASLSKTIGVNHNSIRGRITILKKYDCIITDSIDSSNKNSERHTVFTIDSDSLSRFYSRLRD